PPPTHRSWHRCRSARCSSAHTRRQAASSLGPRDRSCSLAFALCPCLLSPVGQTPGALALIVPGARGPLAGALWPCAGSLPLRSSLIASTAATCALASLSACSIRCGAENYPLPPWL